jgi:serine/threonine protein kinase
MTGIGTISYMAPEIYRMKAYDHTVDIYALGLVLYQLLNRGRAPFLPDYPKTFTTADVDSANYRRLNGHTIERLKGIDDELDRIVRKACAYNARERYQSAEEMKSDIDNYLWKNSIQKKEQDAALSGHSLKFDSEDSSHYTADSKNRKANKTEGSVFEYADSGKSKRTVNTDVYTKDKYLEKSSIRKKRQLFLVTGIFLLIIIVLLSVLLMNYLHLKEKENNDRVSSESEDTEDYGTYSNPDAHFSMHYYYEEGRDDIGHWYVYNYDTDKRIRLSDLTDYNDVYNDAIENRSSAEFWKLIAFLLGILLLSCLAFQFIRKAYNEKHGAINRV